MKLVVVVVLLLVLVEGKGGLLGGIMGGTGRRTGGVGKHYNIEELKTILKGEEHAPGIAIGFSPDFSAAGLFVAHNFFHNLPDGWVVVIVTKELRGNETEKLLKELVVGGGGGRRKIIHAPILSNFFTRPNYSCLLLEKSFYEAIPTEHILIFQEDTLILRKDDGKNDTKPERYKYIRDFFEFPYIGAPWIWRDCQGEWNVDKLCRDSGNGGLSLRRKSIMINITSELPSVKSSCRSEDLEIVYTFDSTPSLFSLLPPRHVGRQFSVETIPSKEPWGVHKPWRFPKWISAYPDLALLQRLQKQPDYSALFWWLGKQGLSEDFFQRFMKLHVASQNQIDSFVKAKKNYIRAPPTLEEKYSEIESDEFYMNHHGWPSFRNSWWNKNRATLKKEMLF